MPDIFNRIWEHFQDRTTGPMSLRFLLQPTVSMIFAIRAALKDAKTGAVPYLWKFLVSKDQRQVVAKDGWKDFGKIFMVGTILDIIYQLIVIYKFKTESHFYPLESLIVAFSLAILPYLLLRGPVNRIVRLFK